MFLRRIVPKITGSRRFKGKPLAYLLAEVAVGGAGGRSFRLWRPHLLTTQTTSDATAESSSHVVSSHTWYSADPSELEEREHDAESPSDADGQTCTVSAVPTCCQFGAATGVVEAVSDSDSSISSTAAPVSDSDSSISSTTGPVSDSDSSISATAAHTRDGWANHGLAFIHARAGQ